MATSSTTSAVYLHVIEDVITKVNDEFILNGGAGEDVLGELQGIWETKMMQAGVILGPADRSAPKNLPGGSAPPPVHDLNVPYEGTEEYETPTADMLFPPTPLQTPLQTPLPGTVDSQLYNIPTGSSDYPTPFPDGMGNSGGNSEKTGTGRPSPYMQPPSPWLTQRPSLDVNVAYVEGRDEVDRGTSQSLTQDFFMPPTGKRKRDDFPSQYKNGQHIPQQDGATDALCEVLEVSDGSASPTRDVSVNTSKLGAISNWSLSMIKIPQVDGPIPDPYDEMLSTPNIYNYQGGVATEDYNVASTPAPTDLQVGTPAAGTHVDLRDEDDDDDDEPLNENDDDDDLDDVDQGEDLNTQHLVLAQFDKVTRTKSRWKCTLKDGIMHINDKDILFNKATGEFEF